MEDLLSFAVEKIMFWWIFAAILLILVALVLPRERQLLGRECSAWWTLSGMLMWLIGARILFIILAGGSRGESRYYIPISLLLILLAAPSGMLLNYAMRYWPQSRFWFYGGLIILMFSVTAYKVFPRHQKHFRYRIADALSADSASRKMLLDLSKQCGMLPAIVSDLEVVSINRKNEFDSEYKIAIRQWLPKGLFDGYACFVLDAWRDDDTPRATFWCRSKSVFHTTEQGKHYELRKLLPDQKYPKVSLSLPERMTIPRNGSLEIDLFSGLPESWQNRVFFEVQSPYGKTYNKSWMIRDDSQILHDIPLEVLYFTGNGEPVARGVTTVSVGKTTESARREWVLQFPDNTPSLPPDALPEPLPETEIWNSRNLPELSLTGLTGWPRESHLTGMLESSGQSLPWPLAQPWNPPRYAGSREWCLKVLGKGAYFRLHNFGAIPSNRKTYRLLIIGGGYFWWGELEQKMKHPANASGIELVGDRIFGGYELDFRRLLSPLWSATAENPFWDNASQSFSLRRGFSALGTAPPDAVLLISGVGSLMGYPDPFFEPESANIMARQGDELERFAAMVHAEYPQVFIGVTTIPELLLTPETCGLYGKTENTPRLLKFRWREFNRMLLNRFGHRNTMITVLPLHAYAWPENTKKRKDPYSGRAIDHSFLDMDPSRATGMMTLIRIWLERCGNDQHNNE